MAFPFFGKVFNFSQPDGGVITVRGWGDQDDAYFETLDGVRVERNPRSGYFEPVGPGLAEVEVRKHLPDVVEGKARVEPRWKARRRRRKALLLAAAFADAPHAAPPPADIIGAYVGLCLLIDFPDVKGTIPREEVDRFCNQPAYSGFGNKGSVYDYFSDNSLGRLRHKSVVTPYYTAKQPKSYYVAPEIPYAERAIELIAEAIAFHKSRGFNFGPLSTDEEGGVLSLSVFYAGDCPNDWQQGLWPHQGTLPFSLELAPGRFGGDYQITKMDSELCLGTFCHEMGHMLCDFPDLYDDRDPGTGEKSFGVGFFCLMGFGGDLDPKNPAQVCAYLKTAAGWANTLTLLDSNMTVTAVAGTNDFFYFSKDRGEYFIIENRFNEGRDSALPDAGLAIWHVDEAGDNSYGEMTAKHHYECSLEQADGLFELEHGVKKPKDFKDLFGAGRNAHFSDTSRPDAKWWDGTASGLEIHDIGPAGRQIQFAVKVG